MSALQRACLLVGSATAAAIALTILIATGLPQRAAFTGLIIPNQRPIAPERNATAPDFTLENASGGQIRLSDLHGKPVIVNFWATWCGPCIVEMPILQSIFEAHRDSDLRILAVNMGEQADTIRSWQQQYDLTYDLLVDEQQTVAALYALRGQPSTYVISPEGVITAIFYGPVSEQALIATLE